MKKLAREILADLHPCQEAMDWIGNRTLRQVWDDCERGAWLFWWAARAPGFVRNGKLHIQIVRCAAGCAERTLHLIRNDELRNTAGEAVIMAQLWAEILSGRHTGDVTSAASAAAGAASDAAWVASDAAWVASDAAGVASAAAGAARAAAGAASAAAFAARDAALAASDAAGAAHGAAGAASDAAGAAEQRAQADFIREMIDFKMLGYK